MLESNILKDMLQVAERQTEKFICLHPYHARKCAVKKYKITFFGLGALFFGLSYLLYRQSPHEFCHMLFQQCFYGQWLATTFSLFLGAAATLIAATMRTETEVMKEITRVSKRKLMHHYSFWKKASRLAYHEAKETIDHLRDHLIITMHRIRNNRELDLVEREDRYNEALVFYRTQIDKVIENFSLHA